MLRDGQLTSLDLRGNELGPAGGSLLAAGLALSSTLQQLQLADTAIGDTGAAAFANALSDTSPMRRLDISGCGFTAEGIEALCGAVAIGAQLQSLTLSRNDGICAAGLAQALQQLPADGTLAELDLSEVPAAADGAVIAALAGLKILQKLTLFACGLGGGGAGAVASQLTDGGWLALQELDLGGNEIDAGAAAHLLAAVRHGGGPALQVIRSSLDVVGRLSTSGDWLSRTQLTHAVAVVISECSKAITQILSQQSA